MRKSMISTRLSFLNQLSPSVRRADTSHRAMCVLENERRVRMQILTRFALGFG
jgi:hypothetical protein